MIDYLPYIVSVLVAVVSGIASYAAASKTARKELEVVKEANKHDMQKLMEQHKIDIDSLERTHQMNIERMKLEHQLELERSQHSFDNNFTAELIKEAMKMPEVRNQIAQGIKKGINRK